MHRSHKKLEILKRRQRVADLFLQGFTQLEIAEQLGVSRALVCQDIKRISDEWRQSAVVDFERARFLELKEIDRIRHEAWKAWERSQKPSQSADIAGEGGAGTTRKRIRNQYGDPRFLMVVHKCVATRRALLGLDAPTKIAPTTPDGEPLDAAVVVINRLNNEEFQQVKEAAELYERTRRGISHEETQAES